MRVLTENADLRCQHEMGRVGIVPSQSLVRVRGRRVLVEPDPVGRPIAGCPNIQPGIKPCTLTLPVKTGYSSLVRIGGRRICLDTLKGLTDGTPPGSFDYHVRSPGQSLVAEKR